MAIKKRGTPEKLKMVTEADLDKYTKQIEDGLKMILKEIRDQNSEKDKNKKS